VYGRVEAHFHVFFTSILKGGELSDSFSFHFSLWERCLGTHRMRGWMGPTVGLVDPENCKTVPVLVMYVVSCPTLAVPRPEPLDLQPVSNRLPVTRRSAAHGDI